SNRQLIAVVRLEADGLPDPTFGIGGRTTAAVGLRDADGRAVAVQPDGRILVAGYAQGTTRMDFAPGRFDADGSVDSSVASGGRAITPVGSSRDAAMAVTLLADGRILVGGWADVGPRQGFALARYQPDGSLDPSFGAGGTGTAAATFGFGDARASAMALQADGRIVMAGLASNGLNVDYALARFDGSGILDPSFDGDGKRATPVGSEDDSAMAVAVQPDGRILAGGMYGSGFQSL